MNRLYAYDDDSILVGVIPHPCPGCDQVLTRVRLSLDLVLASQGDFVGIRTVKTSPCCGTTEGASYPAESLAELLDHLKDCPHH